MAQKIKVKKVKNYLLLNEIGKGNFSQVYQSILEDQQQKGEYYAVKLIYKHSNNIDYFEREIQNMTTVQHQNLVKLHEAFLTQNNYYLVMEFMEGGTLKDYLQSKGGKVSEEEALLIFLNLVEGLKALNDNKIVHRDLKPTNILLSSKVNPIFKIGDFGLSKVIDEEKSHNTICGTPDYLAPEVILGEKYNHKVDI